MLGYQTMDGVPITVNDWLLGDVLRGEWGYPGTLITDWDNVGRMVWEQQVQPDHTHAAAAAVRAGNDMVMTTPQFFEGALDAISRGLLVESDLHACGQPHPHAEVRARAVRGPAPCRTLDSSAR